MYFVSKNMYNITFQYLSYLEQLTFVPRWLCSSMHIDKVIRGVANFPVVSSSILEKAKTNILYILQNQLFALKYAFKTLLIKIN